MTPSHTGYTFSPTSQSATVNGANVTGVNFTATAQTSPTFSISGTITPTAGGSGATLVLSGAATASTTANGSGSYTLLAWRTEVCRDSEPSGYTFAPTSQSATVNGANVTGINFTATAQTSPTLAFRGQSPDSGRERGDGKAERGSECLDDSEQLRRLHVHRAGQWGVYGYAEQYRIYVYPCQSGCHG